MSSLPRSAPVEEFSLALRDVRREVKQFQRTLAPELLEREENPIEIMRWKQIYERRWRF